MSAASVSVTGITATVGTFSSSSSSAATSGTAAVIPSTSHSALCVTGLASFNVGMLAPGESCDTTLTVCALTGGLQELRSISVVDCATGTEYHAGPLLKVFVHDDNFSAADL